MKLFKTLISAVLLLSMLFSVCFADFISEAPVLTDGSETIEIEWKEKSVVGTLRPDDVTFKISISMKGKKPTDYEVWAELDGEKERQIAKLAVKPYRKLEKSITIGNVDCGKRNIKLTVKKNGEAVFTKEEKIDVSNLYTKQFMDEIADFEINVNTFRAEDIPYLQNAGITEFRRSYYWHKTEQTKGVYKTEVDDPIKDKVIAAGMRTTATGGFANQLLYPMWESQEGKPLPTQLGVTNGPHTQAGIWGYVNYVKHGLIDICPELKLIEVWNEPNLSTYLPKESKNHNYLNLLKAVTAGVRSDYKNERIGGFVFSSQSGTELFEQYFDQNAYPYIVL